jgi:hypothetical protein
MLQIVMDSDWVDSDAVDGSAGSFALRRHDFGGVCPMRASLWLHDTRKFDVPDASQSVAAWHELWFQCVLSEHWRHPIASQSVVAWCVVQWSVFSAKNIIQDQPYPCNEPQEDFNVVPMSQRKHYYSDWFDTVFYCSKGAYVPHDPSARHGGDDGGLERASVWLAMTKRYYWLYNWSYIIFDATLRVMMWQATSCQTGFGESRE